jgi:hypothetical protein
MKLRLRRDTRDRFVAAGNLGAPADDPCDVGTMTVAVAVTRIAGQRLDHATRGAVETGRDRVVGLEVRMIGENTRVEHRPVMSCRVSWALRTESPAL